MRRKTPIFLTAKAVFLAFAILLSACSFDYGSGQDGENDKPDIIMENIEYVRVRKGDMLARFRAEHAERWEERQVMALKNFTFEQMEDHGQRVNVGGNAGAASVQLESGDITLSDGVKISIESEDLIINIAGIEWKDKEKTLTGASNDKVDVQRSDGTSFTGIGFQADIRSRTWSFSGEVKGTYVEKDE
jgi:LPS export ABC transporter protein LptC